LAVKKDWGILSLITNFFIMNPSTIAKMAMVPLPLTREVILLNNNLSLPSKKSPDIIRGFL
ncbi:MAG: hypothetical protein IKL57_09265, partial [Oscillospiraceae bacterium]|nr:hypothetical protein [Oscillospiraceae bacterium]